MVRAGGETTNGATKKRARLIRGGANETHPATPMVLTLVSNANANPSPEFDPTLAPGLNL